MFKLKKAKFLIISFALAVMISVSVIPFSSAAYTERDKIIDIALSEVGYTQKNGYNKFGAEFGSGYGAWCNYFVVWCAKEAGISPEKINCTSSYDGNCYSYLSAMRSEGRFFENDGSYTPKKGDLVFYNSSRSTSGSNHIGFVLSADENTVTTVEGNVSVNGTRGVGKNVRQRYSYVGNMVIIGFGVPAYSGEEVPKAQIKKTSNSYNNATERLNAVRINPNKFETHASVEERLKLREEVMALPAPTTPDFICVLDPAHKYNCKNR